MSTNPAASHESPESGTRAEGRLPVAGPIPTPRAGIGARWHGRYRPGRGGRGMWTGLVLATLSLVLLAAPPARAQQCDPPTVSVERLGVDVVAPRSPGATFQFTRTGDTAGELEFQYRLTSNGLSILNRVGQSDLAREDGVHSVAFSSGDQHFALEIFGLRPAGDPSTDNLEMTVEVAGGEGSPCRLYEISQTAPEASVFVEPFARIVSVEASPSPIFYEGLISRIKVTLDKPAIYNHTIKIEGIDQSSRPEFRTAKVARDFLGSIPFAFTVRRGEQSGDFQLVFEDDEDNPTFQDREELDIRLTRLSIPGLVPFPSSEVAIEVREEPPALESVVIDPPEIMEGGRATVTVTLDRPPLPYENVSLFFEEDPYDEENGRGPLRAEGLGPLDEIVLPQQGATSTTFVVVAPDHDNLVQDPETRTIRIKFRNQEDDYFDDMIEEPIEIRDDPDPAPKLASIEIEPPSIMEGGSATVTVTLDRPAPEDLYLSYDEIFGDDDTGRGPMNPSGELVVRQGESSMSFFMIGPEVDNILQGPETRTIRITNGDDGPLEGTIEIHDSMEGMESLRDRVVSEWLPRFARTVAGIVMETIGGRSVDDGPRRDRVVIGGQLVTRPAEAAGGGHALAGRAEELSFEDVLRGSSFSLSRGDGGSDHGWTLWGEWAQAGFDGLNGDLSVDGRVASGVFGFELASENWMTGLALFHGQGEGGYEEFGLRGETVSDDVEAWLTSAHPYLRWNPDEATTLWGTLGHGWGEMTVSDPTGDHETDIAMALGALGGSRELLSTDGFDLAVKSDAFWSHVTSEETEALAAERGDVYRIRAGLEGRGHEERFDNGARLRPSLEVAIRYDGGEVETGAGLEMGGAISYVDPRFGLTAEASGRVLLLHADSGYEEWGVAGLLRLDPGSQGRGLSLALAPSWGTTAADGADRLGADRALVSLAGEREEAAGRVALRLGYGVSALAGAGLLTPHASMTLTDDGAQRYGTGLDLNIGPNFSLGLESTHRLDTDNDDAIWLRGRMRW